MGEFLKMIKAGNYTISLDHDGYKQTYEIFIDVNSRFNLDVAKHSNILYLEDYDEFYVYSLVDDYFQNEYTPFNKTIN